MSRNQQVWIFATLLLAVTVVIVDRRNRAPRVVPTTTATPAPPIEAPSLPSPAVTRLEQVEVNSGTNEPTARARNLQFTVVSRLGRSPVVGAALELWFEKSPSAATQCTTDSEGKTALEFVEKAGVATMVRVRAAGFALREVPLEPADDRVETTIELDKGGVLAGRVVRKSAHSVPPEVKVAAWRQSSNGDRMIDFGPSSQWSLCTVVEADAEGRFQFNDLLDGVVYRLDAGGGGCVSDGFTSCARVPTQDARVEVTPVFACIVEGREAGGAPLRASRELRSSSDMFEMVADGDADPMPIPRLLALAGSPLPAEVLSDRQSLLLMYAKETDAATIGPARFLLGVAGYQTKRVEVSLPRLVTSVERRLVELEPLGQHGFGDLVVDFIDPPWKLESGRSGSRLVGELGMKTLEPGIPVLTFPIRATIDGRVELHGIPYGLYRAVFHTTGRQYSLPNKDVPDLVEFTIGPAPASATFRFGALGRLRFDVRGHDREPFELTLSAQVRRTGDPPNGSMYPLHFLDPPYRVDAFRCGTYDILFTPSVNPSIGVARPVQFRSVTVEPSKEMVLEVEVVIDPPVERS